MFTRRDVLKLSALTLTGQGIFLSKEVSVWAAANRGMISFVFHDGLPSTYNTAYGILTGKGMPGTVYVVPGYIGDGAHMTWAQLFTLYWNGWEVANHTMNHLHFSGLTDQQILTEIKSAQDALIAHGLIGSGAFTPPFGDPYDYVDYPGLYERMLAILKQLGFVTSSCVPWDDTDIFNLPDGTFDPWKINSFQLINPRKLVDVKPLIDEAVSQKKWLVFTSHDVLSSTNEEDGLNTAVFQSVVNYVTTLKNAGKIDVVTVSKGVGKLMYYQGLL